MKAFFLQYKKGSRWILWLCFHLFFLVEIASAAPISLTDMANRKIILLQPAKRIVSITPANTMCVLVLGLEDRLIAVDHETQKNPIALAIRPDLAKLHIAGKSNTFFFETLLPMKPDLVILSARKDGLITAKRLQKMGIPAVIIHLETFEKVNTSIRLIAKATGTEKRGEFVCRTLQNTLQKAQKGVQHIPANKRKKVYYAGPSHFFSVPSGSLLQTDMIQKAGGISVSQNLVGYFQTISPEQFIQWKPDIILVNTRTKDQIPSILAQPQYKTIPAVQHKAIYVFPDTQAYWDFPSPLAALGVLWAAYQLYPEQFSHIPFEKEANQVYRAFFNLSWPVKDSAS